VSERRDEVRPEPASAAAESDFAAALARAAKPGARLAVLCVGSVLCGDDAAGMLLAPKIRAAAEAAGCLVAEGSTAPENLAGVIRRYRPETLVLVDAAELGLAPGSVRAVSEDQIAAASVSTHMMPLKFLTGYLRAETGCACLLAGIQPQSVEPAVPPSPAVLAAVDALAEQFRTAFAAVAGR
jgi:hydrogenase 3 maturation protease